MSDPITRNAEPTARPASEIERVEIAIVDHLARIVPNDAKLQLQPDDPAEFMMGDAPRAALVHFLDANAALANPTKVAGRTAFAINVLARSQRGHEGGLALLQIIERALAGVALPGCRAFAVRRSGLAGQTGGLWRWTLEIETETLRGVSMPPAAPFVSDFQEVRS